LPVYKGQIKERLDHYLVLFAHPYNVPETENSSLVATDKAGNRREMKLVYELKNVKYKKSTIQISEDFVQQKVAPLLNDVGARQGSPKDIFIKVNKNLRKENEDKIRSITEKSTPTILWHGAFSQLTNSKVEANFADARTYIYTTKRSIRRIMSATTYRSQSITRPRRPTAVSSRSSVIWESTATRSSSIMAWAFSPSTLT
jgi:hypothetical protein